MPRTLVVPAGDPRRLRAAPDRVARALLEMARDQDLQPGDRLPTVLTLASAFGVAPPTMREALQRLEATGAVELRHGSGTYLRDVGNRRIMLNPAAGAIVGKALIELVDARLVVEPALAEMAAMSGASVADRLSTLLAEAGGFLSGDDVSLTDRNLTFHVAIARASGNQLLADMVTSLMELHRSEQMLILRIHDDRERDFHDHAAIADAVRSHDGALARTLMREHLEQVRDTVARAVTRRRR